MAQIKKGNKERLVSRALLRKSGIRPKKRLGQVFLEDPVVIEKIIAHANFDKDDVVMEIGSGLGALTIPILPTIYHFVAVEKDPVLIAIVREKVSEKEKHKITFIHENVLNVDFKEIYDTFHQKIRIIGNLPYNISSPFLEKLIINRDYIKNAILMFQYEFAQRLTGAPQKKEYGALSIISQYYATISQLLNVKRDAFYPKPKVDSMVLKMDFTKPYHLQAKNEVMFRKTVKAAFSCRRKTILNSLERGRLSLSKEMIATALDKCFIDPKRRAETLTIDEYLQLSSALMPIKTIP